MVKKQKMSDGFISTEDWLPIVDIKNNMIEVKGSGLSGNQYVTGVRIEPKNIFIADSQVQANTLTGLRDFYNTIDYEFWLIVADRPVDISVYLSQLQLAYTEEENPAIRKLIAEDIEKGRSFINNNVVDTEYFILFKEKNTELLQKKIRQLISGLSAAGLVARQTNNEDLRIILDNFLNGGQTTTFGMVMSL